ncbi:MAG TPA: PIN domain-containing protein [Candidatus Nanoarchaeia archaeon]|nr:PIN domain-containing protein [Candidatus Nanoarchaeia archaeon]
MQNYFFDTYALVELVKSSPNYTRYAEEIVTTSILNLIELGYVIARDFNEAQAKIVIEKFKACTIKIPDEVILEAIKLKLRKKELSYADCIGYCLAIKCNLKFLTGDKHFKGLQYVEFVV